ncbi:MAG: DUF2089 family protein [Cryomorphaceae bacterium]|nr:DUF2089 family protein [Cryomorphaceae bacterium]
MEKPNKVPTQCPACNTQLHVQRMHCGACGTSVEGSFSLPILVQLNADELNFLMQFIKSSGSLKEMAKHTGHSYPKVRNTLDDIIKKVKSLEAS